MIVNVEYPTTIYFSDKVDVEAIIQKYKTKYKGRHVSSGCGFWPGANRDIQMSFTKENAKRFRRSISRLKALKGKKVWSVIW